LTGGGRDDTKAELGGLIVTIERGMKRKRRGEEGGRMSLRF